MITLLALSRALSRASIPYGFASCVLAGFMALGRDQIAMLCAWLLIFLRFGMSRGGIFCRACARR